MNKVKNTFICLFFFSLVLHAEASEPIRLGVMPFMSKASEVPMNLASKVTDMIVRNLYVSQTISVIERERLRVIASEQGINLSSGVANQDLALRLGNLAGCRYMLLGSITQFAQKYENRLLSTSLLGYQDTTIHEITAVIEARLIDTATGKVVLSISRSGSAVKEGEKRKSYQNGFGSLSQLKEQAIEAASSRICDKVREVLANEYPMIISVSKNNIRINRGSTSSVNVGALYKVYQEGEELFDLNGQSLGKRIINLAILRVVNVSSEFSTVEVLDNRPVPTKTANKKSSKQKKTTNNNDVRVPSLIREGDKIEAISLSEAENLKLATQRF